MLKSAILSTMELDMSWVLGGGAGAEKALVEEVEIFPAEEEEEEGTEGSELTSGRGREGKVRHPNLTPERGYLARGSNSSAPPATHTPPGHRPPP